jgi:hypothetical protein
MTDTHAETVDAVSILRDARTKISDPERWGKGRRNFDRPQETFCIAEAIEECVCLSDEARHARRQAIRAFYNAAGIDADVWGSLTNWNDVPERKHRDVIAALDLAIATLRLR